MTGPSYSIDGDIVGGAAAMLESFLTANPGPVIVHINSDGGIATEGAAMMAAMERHGNVTVRIEGRAISAASLAAMGGRKVQMHDLAIMMIHSPSAMTAGTADKLRADAAALDKMNETYARGYARATGQPVERVLAWMADETWLTAEEAVALGFADEVYQGQEMLQVAALDLSRFKNMPPDMKALALKQGQSNPNHQA
jgi:ATP-dependent Clp protease, protease subunit